MKKIVSLGFAALLVAGLAGCVNESLKTDKGQIVTINADRGEFVEEGNANKGTTRIYHDPSTGQNFWQEGDKIGIFVEGSDIKNHDLTGVITDGGRHAAFSGQLNEYLEDGTYNVYAYYPHGEIDNISQTHIDVRVEVPTIQNPTTTTFDPRAAILVSSESRFEVNGDNVSEIKTQFQYAVSFANILLSSDIAALVDNEPLVKFTMTSATTDIAGVAELNLVDGLFGSFHDSASKSITANIGNDFVINGTHRIHLGLIPTSDIGEVTFTIETENHTLTKTATLNNPVFTKGVIKHLNVGATGWEEKADEQVLIYHESFDGLSGSNTNTGSTGGNITLPYLAHAPENGGIGGILSGGTAAGTVRGGGDAILLGSGSNNGAITTRDLDLSKPFTVKVIAKGWTKSGRLDVTAGGNTLSETIIGAGSGTNIQSEWAEYTYEFEAIAGGTSEAIRFEGFSITSGDRRIFIDDIKIYSGGEISNEPYFSAIIDKSLLNLPANETTTGIITITSNTDWSILADDWIGLSQESGNGSAEITYTISINQGDDLREGHILVAPDMADAGEELEVVVTQLGQQSSIVVTDFSAGFKTFGRNSVSPEVSLASNVNNSGGNIVIGNLTPTNMTGGSLQNGWGGTGWNTNTIDNPARYATFTVSSTKTFSLSELNIALRASGTGPKTTTLQYSIDGGVYTTIGAITGYGTGAATKTVTLSNISALQGVASGTTVTFRFIPTGASAAGGTWYIGDNNFGDNPALTVDGSYF